MAHPTYQWHPPERGWQEQDLLDLPEDGNRYEIIDGSLHVTPPAGPDHHGLADDIRMALRPAAPTGWRVIRVVGVRSCIATTWSRATTTSCSARSDRTTRST